MSHLPRIVRKVQVQFEPHVTREEALAAVEKMFRLSGCVSCGLRGIDLTMLGGDPERQFDQLRQLPSARPAR